MTSQQSTEEIESEIQRLRRDMDSTIEEIEERLEMLRPRRLAQRGKNTMNQKLKQVLEAGEQSGKTAVREVKQKPAIGVIGGVAVALLVARLMGFGNRD